MSGGLRDSAGNIGYSWQLTDLGKSSHGKTTGISVSWQSYSDIYIYIPVIWNIIGAKLGIGV